MIDTAGAQINTQHSAFGAQRTVASACHLLVLFRAQSRRNTEHRLRSQNTDTDEHQVLEAQTVGSQFTVHSSLFPVSRFHGFTALSSITHARRCCRTVVSSPSARVKEEFNDKTLPEESRIARQTRESKKVSTHEVFFLDIRFHSYFTNACQPSP